MCEIKKIFNQSLSLINYGEYVSGDSFILRLELSGDVVITIEDKADTLIQIREGGQLVFHALETYWGELTVFVFDEGGWVDTLNAAFYDINE